MDLRTCGSSSTTRDGSVSIGLGLSHSPAGPVSDGVRRLDIAVLPGGSLLVSDDRQGAIYWITNSGEGDKTFGEQASLRFMSEFGYERTFSGPKSMSALPPKASTPGKR